MTGAEFKLLILAERLNWHDGGWPLTPLLDRLARRGCHVQVLCISRGSDLHDDPRVLELPALGRRWLRSVAIRGVWTHDQLQRPDLLHVIHDEMGEVALAMSETARLPYVQTVSRFGTVAQGLRLSRRWCRRLVVTNDDLARELIEELGLPRDRLTVVLPGMTPYLTHSPHAREGKVPVIGTGGPLEEASGMMAFLEAARIVLDAGYDVEFVIASQGSQQIVLRHFTQRLRIADRVTMADYPSLKTDFWSVLDIYCQPAVVSSTGRTLIQAMGQAIPCIATNVKGLRTVIDPGENGMLVPPADPGSLAKALIALLERPGEARRLGSRALLWARAHFDPDNEADRLVDLYRDASNSPSRSSSRVS